MNSLIPGLVNSKLSNPLNSLMSSPQLRGVKISQTTAENFDNPDLSSMPFDNRGIGMSSTIEHNQMQTHFSRYDPITNPAPNNVQNPYFVKNTQQGSHPSKSNVFATMANNNLLKH